MKFTKNLSITLLFFFFGLCTAIQASTEISRSSDLSDCQLIRVSTDQILLSETGIFILETKTSNPVQVDGFIYHGDELFAIQAMNIKNIKVVRSQCGHELWCCTCFGCGVKGCWGYCDCCPMLCQ